LLTSTIRRATTWSAQTANTETNGTPGLQGESIAVTSFDDINNADRDRQ
jgi:TolB-like protein